jgi:hypothetical protein
MYVISTSTLLALIILFFSSTSACSDSFARGAEKNVLNRGHRHTSGLDTVHVQNFQDPLHHAHAHASLTWHGTDGERLRHSSLQSRLQSTGQLPVNCTGCSARDSWRTGEACLGLGWIGTGPWPVVVVVAVAAVVVGKRKQMWLERSGSSAGI